MRVSRQKAAENRERIIDAAASLFRAKGFNGIGVADIMKAARSDARRLLRTLRLQGRSRRASKPAGTWRVPPRIGRARYRGRAKDPYAALLQHYLTPRHRDEPGHGCAFAALSGRPRAAARRCAAFADGLRPLIEILAKAVPGRSKAARRRKAVATMAGLVGAVTLARAVGDQVFRTKFSMP